jgi:glycosyltransferase involved in cell wall biosynthesis
MTLKIGLVSPRFLNEDMRGGEEAVRTLFNHIDKRNQVSVLTSDTIDVSAQHSFSGKRTEQKWVITDRGREIIYFKSDPVMTSIFHYSYFLGEKILRRTVANPVNLYPLDLLRTYGWGPYVLNLSDHIASKDYDVIHGAIFPTTISFQALKAAKMSNKPFVFTPYYHYKIPEFYGSAMLKWIVSNSSGLIACTRQEKYALIKLGVSSDKVFVIPLAFDRKSVLKFGLSHEESKNELNLEGRFVILAHPWSAKGAIFLLRVLKILSKKHNNIALLTIGEPDKEYLSNKDELVGQNGTFIVKDMGWVSGKTKWAAFSASDLFCMVSNYDAFGLSYLNAWAFQKPVIGASNSFAEGVIKNGVDGMLVSQDDPLELSAAIENIMSDPNLRAQMGMMGERRLEWEFHPDRVAQEHEHVYNVLLQH